MREALHLFLAEELAGIRKRREDIRKAIGVAEKQDDVLSGAEQACEKMLAVLAHPELGISLATSNVVTIGVNNDSAAQAA